MESAVPPRSEAIAAFDPRLISLDQVVITDRLRWRTSRPPDHAGENEALHALARRLSNSPSDALQALLDRALVLCELESTGSAGISLLESSPDSEEPVFRWTALAGRIADRVGYSTPRGFSPCGVCLERGAPVLYAFPERYFRYLQESVDRPVVEGLVVPFRVDGQLAGTLWILTHEEGRSFDAEDVRVMTGLSDFAGALYSLLESRSAAEAAKQASGELLEMLSHDLRTPLAAIGGYAEALERGARGPLSAEQRADLARIRDNHSQALRLLDSVLEAAQGDNGLEYAREAVPLPELFADVVGTVRPLLHERRLTLDMDLPSGSDVVAWADPDKVRQVVLNLVSNAIKFTPPEGRIALVARQQDREVVVVVRDDGIGIPPDRLEDIFHPFVRLDRRRSADGGPRRSGAGLGLTICRRLVRGMGGRISVESEPDHGSTFTVHLPAPGRGPE